LLTRPLVTFRELAKTVWLTCSLSRIALIFLRLQGPDRRKTGIIETPYRLFVDGPNIVQGLHGLVDGRHRITPILFAHSLFTSMKSPRFNSSAAF